VAWLLAGCLAPQSLATPLPAATAAPPLEATATPGPADETPREIVILQTNDEHGALLPTEQGGRWVGGAAYALGDWIAQGLDPRPAEGPVLLLSCGDNWTGPAISTWFAGASTVAAMNTMGYRLSVIGNHEFDFGQEALRQRLQEAGFPFLAANLYVASTTEPADFVVPYVLVPVNGVTVGVIGLALQSTPRVTSSRNLSGLEFGDYETALRRYAPEARAAGAQVLVAATHIEPEALLELAEAVADLDIAYFGGGHTHRALVSTAGGAQIAAASSHWRDYVRTRLLYDPASGRVTGQASELVAVDHDDSAVPEPETAAAVALWEERSQAILGEVIGYAGEGLDRDAPALQNLLVDSWLWAYDDAEISISNTGGFRQDLAGGEITLGTMVSVLPFDNVLYEISMTGRQVQTTLSVWPDELVFGGLRRGEGGRVVLAASGEPLDPEASYRVLVTDYIYGNDKYPFRGFDDTPYETGISWRQPAIDWIRVQHSSHERPLEQMLDGVSRF
jgi:5'-nucleotidase/UDP-sugar diphosphatase